MTTFDTPDRPGSGAAHASAVLAALAVPALLSDAEGIVAFANAAAEAAFGFGPGALTGIAVEQLVPRRLRAGHAGLRVAYTDVERPRPMAEHQSLLASRRDGTEFPVEVSLSPLVEDGERFVIAIVTDLTERLAAQREAERARDLLGSALTLAKMAYWVEDRRTGILATSPELRRMVGTDEEEIAFETLVSWVHPDDRASLVPIRARGLEGEDSHFDFRVVTSSGEVLAAQALATDLPTEPWLRLGVVQDISELREAEEALRHLQKLEAIGGLAGGIAHDFNNLLTVITGYTQLAATQSPDEAAVSLGQVRAAAERAAELTDQLLTISRRQRIRLEPVSLTRQIEEIATVVRRLLPESITVVTQLDPDLPGCLADPAALKQILLNLAANARDAMPAGGTLTLVTRRTLNAVKLIVSDTGHGMTEETRRHLFEPFYTTRPAGAGTGLGLSTVQAIVIQTGGTITVESRPGQGASFTLTFPTTDAAPRPETRPAPPRAGERVEPRTGTILVCEDHPDVRAYLAAALAAAGHTVLEAADGKDALEVALEHDGRIDLLVTDLVMPRMDGRELARRLALERPTTSVIFTSGYDQEEFSTRGADPGTRFLKKPYDPADMLRLVERALGA